MRLLAALRNIIADFKSVQKKFEDQGTPVEDIKQYLEDFKELRDRNKIKNVTEKNIDHWGSKPWEEFKEFVDKLKVEKTKSEERKIKKMEGAELVIENDDWFVYRIYTHDAARIYGSETKWCITQETSSHWNNYSKAHNFYMLISKYLDKSDRNYKICILVDKANKRQHWNAEDQQINKTDFNSIATELDVPDLSKLEPFETQILINGKMYKANEIPDNLHVKETADTRTLRYGGPDWGVMLDLSSKGLTKLPEGLVVDALDISDNPIKELPQNLKVKNYFNFSKTEIQKIPAFNIKEIVCKSNEITEINEEVEAESLDLSHSIITYLPKLKKVSSLKLDSIKVDRMDIDDAMTTLDISGIKLKYLPALTLSELIANGSRIDKIDPNLKVQHRIEMKSSKIKRLPDNLNLHVLILSGSNLPELPKNLKAEILDLSDTKNIKSVEGVEFKDINICRSEIEILPENVTFDQLVFDKRVGDLQGTKLRKLPKTSGEIPFLDLSNSMIEELPDTLIVKDSLILRNTTKLKKLPKKLQVGDILSLVGSGVTKLPAGLKVNTLIMDKDLIIPKGAKVNSVHRK